MDFPTTGGERAKMIDYYVDRYLTLSTTQEIDFSKMRLEMEQAGVPADAIELIVRFVDEGMFAMAANGGSKQSLFSSAKSQILIAGIVLMGIGIYTTMISYNSAASGGRFVVTYGIILGGLSLVLTGLAKRRKHGRKLPKRRRIH